MANSEHIAWLREGAHSWNESRRRNPFTPDLSSEDISRQLGGHEREDIRKITVRLKGINLSGANLSDATLRDTDLTGAAFLQADLIRAKLIGSHFTGATFGGGSLRGAKLRAANLADAKFWSVDLTSAQLVGANLKGAQFWQCKLEGAHLYNADLVGADFVESRPWTALLFFPSQDKTTSISFDREIVNGIDDLLNECRKFREGHGDDIVLYFRGESRCCWDLRPSAMRVTSEGKTPFRPAEREMLNDLMIREPETFNGLGSALAEWVLAQHHGLKTRLLDITRNPLVALFNACDDDREKDGRLHVFAVPRSLIKPFSSDTVGILANFAKLPREDQNVLLGKTEEDVQGDVFPGRQNVLESCEGYARARSKLYALIRQEKPYFEERLDIRDLFRVFVIEPQRMFERIRAQSGAFLISAFHERFERDEILRWNNGIPLYSHYVLPVPRDRKRQIVDDLQLLNVTRATLLPSIDESAKAVTRHYTDRTS